MLVTETASSKVDCLELAIKTYMPSVLTADNPNRWNYGSYLVKGHERLGQEMVFKVVINLLSAEQTNNIIALKRVSRKI